jgi:hypothetical protein
MNITEGDQIEVFRVVTPEDLAASIFRVTEATLHGVTTQKTAT